MKHRYYPILLLYFFQVACMPEERSPYPSYRGNCRSIIIECLLSTRPAVRFIGNECASGIRKICKSTFSKRNESDHSCRQSHFTDTYFIHSPRFRVYYTIMEARKNLKSAISITLLLDITTIDHKSITASTSIPPAVSIYNCQVAGNEAIIRFYISEKADENYYIYTAEAVHADSILNKEVCYLDYSEFQQEGLTEKSVILPDIGQAEEIIFTLKRITKANYDYQVSLNAANTANQSSITTPVPLKGNLQGALGIFTCYTEDKQTVPL